MVTVQRLLLSEFHLGYITYEKIRTKRGQVEIVPEEERIQVMGKHEKLKTQEEHDAIVKRLVQNRLMNPNNRRNIISLSGLLYCVNAAVERSSEWAKAKNRANTGARYAITIIRMAANVSRRGRYWTKSFSMLYFCGSLM
ncbi:recombinase family protein [Paenibacillus sp. CN-4]|uniref:recombinase family protein n=1 Tax=Paenibacillus nanchangensis TaxID=3348343 RepID=UPI00397DAC28